MDSFRDLVVSGDINSAKLVDNFRPTQDICRRKIKACIKMSDSIE